MRPFDNFFAESLARVDHFRVGPHVKVKVCQLPTLGLNGFGDGHSPVDKVDDPFEVGLLEASGGQGMGPQSDAPRHQGTFVTWHRVLVQGDLDLVAHIFNSGTVDTLETEPGFNLLYTDTLLYFFNITVVFFKYLLILYKSYLQTYRANAQVFYCSVLFK